ncbi:MAG: aminodeoxychorismate/anthranilate synthase component II, partial [Gemmatimonadaceae bacterium]|nr:aminodeoxychorismate/anthranilate synthase component II [Gemmatimonadaceae bacterium]
MLLVIDNYDSFTYNLVQYLGELGEDPQVRRNDETSVSDVQRMAPSAIVLSPGPGVPSDAGCTISVIRECGPTVPVLGVCLGHQAIGEAYGARVVQAKELKHGKTSQIRHSGKGIFDGIESPLQVMRYHSLVIDPASLPRDLEVIATSEADPTEIQAVKHKTHPVWGVQFHPESVLTQGGREL